MEDVNSGGRHELEAIGGEGDLRERIKAEACRVEYAPSGASAGRIGAPLMG